MLYTRTCIFPWNSLQKVKNSYKINKSIWADERKLHQMPKKKTIYQVGSYFEVLNFLPRTLPKCSISWKQKFITFFEIENIFRT